MSTLVPSALTPANAEESHRTKGLVRLTMACNERCPFCNVPVEDYPRPTPPPEETAQDLDAFVASGEQTLVISGGEPTLLRRRLVDLTRTARDRGIPFVELQTNAVLIDDAYASALEAAGLTSAFVSLLSHIPEHHDHLAGLDGAFKRCLSGIDALLERGIRVTLNPVIARRTQTLVAEYIDFIAERLPRVRSISLSAVQPHGRAADHPELLPDYDVLAVHVRQARTRAEASGIELINPYCGLPLCIGWEDGMDTSVEAIEAATGNTGSGPTGIDNSGNKSQLAACRRCALRTRCGGAWHAYWQHRDGAGIAPPFETTLPWHQEGAAGPGQTTVRAQGGITEDQWRAAHAATSPTVWIWTDKLADRDAARLIRSGCTDLAIDVNLSDPRADWETLRQLGKLHKATVLTSPQRRLRIHIGWDPGPEPPPPGEWRDAMTLAASLGTATLVIEGSQAEWIEEAQRVHPDIDIVMSR